MKFFSILLCFFYSLTCFSQFVLNNNQESGQYQFIENEHIKVVYIKGFKKRAENIINFVSQNIEALNKGFKHPHKKITVVLRSNTLLSNGYVRLAPYKSEFFDAPFIQGELDFGNWLETLSIHEFRHVNQYAQQFDGVNKWAYIVAGETAVALLSHWSIPTWAFEGDAVIAETELSDSGRGRSAAFMRRFRQLILDNDNLSYDELYFGADDLVIPSYYKFGYFFLMFLEKEYGFDTKRAFSESARKSFNPYAFLRVIRAKTKKNTNTIIQEFLSFYKKRWGEQPHKENPNSVALTTKGKYQTDFIFPLVTPDNSLVYLKKGLGNIPEFIKKNKFGHEEHLHYPGHIISNSIRFSEDTIFWTELRLSARWSSRTYSVMCALNTKTQSSNCQELKGSEVSFDKRGQKYLMARFHGKSQIILKNQDKTKEETLIESEETLFINPFFVNEDLISFISKDIKGIFKLETLNIKTKERKSYLKTKKSIRRPFGARNKVFFEWENDQTEQIYSVNLENEQIVKHTNVKYSAMYPFIKNNHLYFSKLKKSGFEIQKQPLSTNSPITKKDYLIYPKRVYVKNQEVKEYEGKNYHDNSFNFHSWLLMPPLILPYWILQASSDNITETVSLSAGFQNNINENTNSVFGNFSYQALYPHLNVGFIAGERTTSADDFKSKWKETTVHIGPAISLAKNFGRWFTQLQGQAYYQNIKVEDKENNFLGEFSNGDYHGSSLALTWTTIASKESLRKNSPLSLNISGVLNKAHQGSDLAGEQKFFTTTLGLPLPMLGNLSFSYQKEIQKSSGYQYASLLLPARGYSVEFSPDIEIKKASFSYPVSFPRYTLFNFFYFRRLDLSLFYDHLLEKSTLASQYSGQSSYGAELTTSFNFTRSVNIPLGIGVRGYYKNMNDSDDNGYAFDLFLDSVITF